MKKSKKRKAPAVARNHETVNVETNPENGNAGIHKDESESQDVQKKFQTEIKWCIRKLEGQISSRTTTPKQTDHMVKMLKILTNPNGQLVKKRKVMWSLFGDYRKLMIKEENELKKGIESMAVTKVEKPEQKGIYRKCCLSVSTNTADGSEHDKESNRFLRSDNSFRFNFEHNGRPLD